MGRNESKSQVTEGGHNSYSQNRDDKRTEGSQEWIRREHSENTLPVTVFKSNEKTHYSEVYNLPTKREQKVSSRQKQKKYAIGQDQFVAIGGQEELSVNEYTKLNYPSKLSFQSNSDRCLKSSHSYMRSHKSPKNSSERNL